MHAPIADFFSLVPEVLISQACFTDIAPFPTPQGEIHLALFARVARVQPADGAIVAMNGKALGVELVAYYCDPDGHVYDWEKRYEVETSSDGPEAIRKLRALLVNDLARLNNYEGFLESLESKLDEAYAFDWAQMPQSLQ
jgi:hypothetical protein